MPVADDETWKLGYNKTAHTPIRNVGVWAVLRFIHGELLKYSLFYEGR